MPIIIKFYNKHFSFLWYKSKESNNVTPKTGSFSNQIMTLIVDRTTLKNLDGRDLDVLGVSSRRTPQRTTNAYMSALLSMMLRK